MPILFDRLIDLVIQFMRLFQFWSVMAPYRGGVRLRLGKFHSLLKVGFNWMLPFNIDVALWDNVVTETMRVKPQSLITKDGIGIVISSVVTFLIDDIKVFLLEVEGKNNVVEDSAYGATSDYVMKHTWGELIALDNLGNELSKAVRKQAKVYGVRIIAVQVADFARCPSFRIIGQDQKPHLFG